MVPKPALKTGRRPQIDGGVGFLEKEDAQCLIHIASIGEADPQLQERLAAVLELRAADPQQRAMLDSYLGDISFSQGA